MNSSFYIAAVGAAAQQERMDNVANNLANINTVGYKRMETTFGDLMKYKMSQGVEQTNVMSGTGVRVENTKTQFTQGSFVPTDNELDFVIDGSGFFALQDPVTGDRTYTRAGNFEFRQFGDTYRLTSASGKLVLDADGQAIEKPVQAVGTEEDDEEPDTQEPAYTIPYNMAVYRFPVEDGLVRVGEGEYAPVAKNGQPQLDPEAHVYSGMQEASNVELSQEMTAIIESQRAYQYALKMVQTSDEVENVINSLR